MWRTKKSRTMTTIAAASATATTASSTMKQWSTSRTFQKHCWKRGIEIVAKKTTSDLKLTRPSILRVTLIVSANHHTPLPPLLTLTSISFINNKNECFAAEGFSEKKHREASRGIFRTSGMQFTEFTFLAYTNQRRNGPKTTMSESF